MHHAIIYCCLKKKNQVNIPQDSVQKEDDDNQKLLHKHRPCFIIDWHNQVNANRLMSEEAETQLKTS